MQSPILIVLAVLAVAVGYVLLPFLLAGVMRWHRARTVRCPHEHNDATVRVGAWRAAVTETVRTSPRLKVIGCSNWPARRGCDQACVAAA